MRNTLPLMLAATLLAACTDSPVLEPNRDGVVARAASAASDRASASVSRPISGTCTLVSVTVLQPAPGQPANVTRRHVDWLCELAHLGRTTASIEEIGTVTASGVLITAIITYTAANGDQLVTSFGGTATFPDQNGRLTFTGTETVTGGTGRFVGASGSMRRTGSVSVVSLSGQYEIRGTVTY